MNRKDYRNNVQAFFLMILMILKKMYYAIVSNSFWLLIFVSFYLHKFCNDSNIVQIDIKLVDFFYLPYQKMYSFQIIIVLYRTQ